MRTAIIRLQIIEPRTLEQKRSDANAIIEILRYWAPILSVASGVQIVLTHQYSHPTFKISFSGWTPNRLPGQVILGSADYYALEINQLLKRQGIGQFYHLEESDSFAFVDMPPPSDIHTASIEEIRQQHTATGFNYCADTTIYPHDRPKPNPGLTFTLIKRNTYLPHLTTDHFMHDAQYIVSQLNSSYYRFSLPNLDQHFICTPAIFVGTEQMSFTIGIGFDFVTKFIDHFPMILSMFEKLIAQFQMSERYEVSSVFFRFNISEKTETISLNHAIIEKNHKNQLIPDEFYCVISQQVMTYPVRLFGCEGAIEFEIIREIIGNGGCNPFTREAMSYSDLVIDGDLALKISAFVTNLELQRRAESTISLQNTNDSALIERARYWELLFPANEIQRAHLALKERKYIIAIYFLATIRSIQAKMMLNMILQAADAHSFFLQFNLADANLQTVLHIAALCKNEFAYLSLRRAGAKDNDLDALAKTPYDYACQQRFSHIVENDLPSIHTQTEPLAQQSTVQLLNDTYGTQFKAYRRRGLHFIVDALMEMHSEDDYTRYRKQFSKLPVVFNKQEWRGKPTLVVENVNDPAIAKTLRCATLLG